MTASSEHPSRIIVIGSERSGTSVTTDMVHRWGAYPGPPDQLAPPTEHSPHGQWEFEPLWDLLVEIGAFAAGVTRWSEAFREQIVGKLSDESLVARAKALMADMEVGERPWVWKDPALCHFLPFWQPLWGDAIYVITVRHPYDVAKSWEHMALPASQRGHVDLTRCNLLRWQYMTLCVLRGTESSSRKIFVEFERVISDPASEATRLAAFLDAQTGRATSDETVAVMAAAVEPRLRRTRFDRPLADVPEASTVQCALYGFVRAKIEAADTRFIDDYPMPEGWRNFVHGSEAVIRGA